MFTTNDKKHLWMLVGVFTLLGICASGVLTSARPLASWGADDTPVLPGNLVAEVPAGLESQVDLRWQDNSSDEDGFEIEWQSAPDGEWSHVSRLGADANDYSDPLAFPSGGEGPITYCYRVRAFNAAGNSDYSNKACATMLDAAPDEKSMLNGIVGCVGDLRQTLSWSPVVSATSYRIVMAQTAGGIVLSDLTTDTSYVLPVDLVTGQEYRWQIKAVNNMGDGPWSESQLFAVCQALTGPVLESPAPGYAGTSSPMFSWSLVPDATTYRLTVSAVESDTLYTFDTVDTSLLPAFDPPLVSGQEYRWRVEALNANGDGETSRSRFFRPGGTVQIGTPAPLSPWFDTVRTGTPVYAWEAASNATEYLLHVKEATGDVVLQAWYPATSICSGFECSVTPATQLGAGQYTWQVWARDGSVLGPWSQEILFAVETSATRLDANTAEGINAVSRPGPGITVTFDVVIEAGFTDAVPVTPDLTYTLPSKYTPIDLAYDFATTAGFQGPVTVDFGVPSVSDEERFAKLRVLHEENGVLVDRTSADPDFAAQTVSARVRSLGLFVIVRTSDPPPPVAYPQSVTTPINTPISVTLDSMVREDAMSVTFNIATSPTHGTLSGMPPEVAYLPNLDFVGEDGFAFEVSDGIASSLPATVTIAVTPNQLFLPLVLHGASSSTASASLERADLISDYGRCSTSLYAQFPVQGGLWPASAEETSTADLDGDGLTQAEEMRLAQAYFPTIWFDKGEDGSCPGGNHNHWFSSPGRLIFRVRPHPDNPDYISIAYVLLYTHDPGYDLFGIGGHNGDAEAFAVTLAPNSACEMGYSVYALTTWAHEGAAGQSTNTWYHDAGCKSRAPAGGEYPVDRRYAVVVAKNKHANYPSLFHCRFRDPMWPFDDDCDFDFTLGDVNAWVGFNAGEEWAAQQLHRGGSSLKPLGFPNESLWSGNRFCGGLSRCDSRSPGPLREHMKKIALRDVPPPACTPPTEAPSPGGPSGTISSSRPTFSWSDVPNATSYTLYVLRVSDEAVVLRQTGIGGTSFTPSSPLPSGVALRWKVKAESSCGAGPYSPSVYFEVEGGSGGPCPPTQAPVSGGPSGSISNSRPTFSWSAVPGAESYTLYVLRVSDDEFILHQTDIGGTSFTPSVPLPSGVALRWKVKAESSCGPGPYSPSVYFTVGGGDGGPCPPTQAPVPGGPSGSISNPRPIFSWSAVPGAESYTLYVLRVSDEAVVLRQTGIGGTSFTPSSPLPSGVALRWKVKAESSCGPGPYSSSVYFNVGEERPLVSITSPAQGETVAGTVAVQTDVADEVTRVEFYVDGVLQHTDITPPYEYAWDTTANPLPAPNHAMDYGYYFVEWKNPNDFATARAEVNGYTNLYYASLASYVSDLTDSEKLQLLGQSLANAVAEGRHIHLNLELNHYPSTLDGVLDTAAPYWDHIVRVELADEPSWTRAEMESWINTVNSKLSARGLTPSPQGLGVMYVYNKPLPDSKNAAGLGWIGIEAYLDYPGSPDPQVNIDNLNTSVSRAMSQVPGSKNIILVPMAYDRNGQWTNIDTLRDLQIPTYLLAYNDSRVISINMFSYTRAGGTRDHPELKTPHRLMGERILGISIPQASDGPRTLTVRAFDAAGNTGRNRVTVTVSNAAPSPTSTPIPTSVPGPTSTPSPTPISDPTNTPTPTPWENDPFDPLATGPLHGQNGWVASSGSPQVIVGGGGKILLIDAAPDQIVIGKDTPDQNSGRHVFEFDVMVNGGTEASIAKVEISTNPGTGWTKKFQIYFGTSMRVNYSPSGDAANIVPATQMGHWYHIRCEMDLTTGLMDVWVDGSLAAEDVVMHPGSITDLSISGWDRPGEVYLDNLVGRPE
jgi:hypothetical protein